MGSLIASLAGAQGMVMGLAAIGCLTAVALNGDISGTQYVATLGVLGVTGGGVGVAHVVSRNVASAIPPPTPPAVLTAPQPPEGLV